MTLNGGIAVKLQHDHTSKQDRFVSIQFELTCSVNADRSTPSQPRLEPRLDWGSLVVWFDQE